MTLAQKYVVMSMREVKSLFLFYQNFAAIFRNTPASRTSARVTDTVDSPLETLQPCRWLLSRPFLSSQRMTNPGRLPVFIPAYFGWLKRFNITRYQFWDSKVALRVLPLGVTYTVMLYSSNYGLSVLTVPMVSVLKNLGPILITVTESYQEGSRLSKSTLFSMMMLLMGSVVAGFNDLKYDHLGYLAMFVNVCTNLMHVQLTKYIQKTGGIKKEVVLHYQVGVALLPPGKTLAGQGAVSRGASPWSAGMHVEV